MKIDLVLEIQKANNYSIALNKLDEFKDRLKKQRKILAKKYHPDLNKNADSDHMSKVNNAYDMLMQLKVQRPQPVQVVRFYTSGSTYTYNTTSTTGTTDGWNNY
jgi:hypothetical protein